jgi:hypothetical protein
MDQFARLLVNIFSHFNRTLPLIRELIEGEFKLVNEANKGAILRGNSMTSKIESAYSRILNQTTIRYSNLYCYSLISSVSLYSNFFQKQI